VDVITERVIAAVTLYTRIPDVLGSVLGRDIVYSGVVLSFPHFLQRKFWDITSIMPRPILLRSSYSDGLDSPGSIPGSARVLAYFPYFETRNPGKN
jgi:hypothetical protein